MKTMRSGRLLAALGSACALLAAPALPVAAGAPTSDAAPAPSGPDLVAACHEQMSQVPAPGDGFCRGLEQLARDGAQLCRFARPTPGTPEEVCSTFDGRVYSEAATAEFEASWVHRALTLQGHIDDAVPLADALIPATHNSFNAASEPPTLSGLDHNQVASLTDQLRMGMRGIELDVHWSTSVDGEPTDQMRAPVVCHAEPVDVSVTTVHAGCTNERHLRDALAEVRTWLDAEANRDEFLLLYLENALDDDPAAHAAAAAAIEATIGDLVLRPSSSCETLPVGTSKRDISTAGGRVLIVGNCGPGAWGSWVHERGVGTTWDEDKSADGDDFVCPPGGYGDGFQRIYEDSTWLSATVEPTGAGSSGEITAAETRAMVTCGLNLFGFDQLVPADPRLEALIWSWAPGQPAAGTSALRGADGRFRAADPAEAHPYVCRNGAGAWHVTAAAGPHGQGDAECAAEAPGFVFAMPATARQNAALVTGDDVWIDYAVVDEEWTSHP